MEVELLSEINKLTDKLYLLDEQIELQLKNSAVEAAELLVVQKGQLIEIITALFTKAESLNLSSAALEVLKMIQMKVKVIFDNNDYIINLFITEKQRLEYEIQEAISNRSKLKGYNLSRSSNVTSTLAP